MYETRAKRLPRSNLPERTRSSLCKNFLQGHCKEGDRCPRSHEICLVAERPSPSWVSIQIPCKWNTLTSAPRIVPKDSTVFDNEGPGYLSSAGMRHDNDHVDIRDIQILPTVDEILCRRPPYMPPKNFNLKHFLEAGQARLLDTLFRQLRYDSVEAVIDICYYASQIMAQAAKEDNGRYFELQTRLETPSGNRFLLFRDVEVEELIFHEHKGIIVRLSYSCPPWLRGRKMHSSSVLEEGMLVALIGIDEEDSGLSIIFFETFLRESTEAMRSKNKEGNRASVQLSFAEKNKTNDIRRLLYYSTNILEGKFMLIEFPRLLLPGFASCLKQLQEQLYTHKFPFSEQIAPSLSTPSSPVSAPPQYSQSESFAFNLSTLRNPRTSPLSNELSRPISFSSSTFDLERVSRILEKETTLDNGQARALCENLTRGLAFTQGPPGTGKTYLGVALVKAIIASPIQCKPKPILAVCMTNHALDSFLQDLLKEGITRIVRLGAGSKEEWIKPYRLMEISNKTKRTQLEYVRLREKKLRVENLAVEGTHWCEMINTSELTWNIVRDHLRAHYPHIHQQFINLNTSDRSLETRVVKRAESFGFHCWSKGADLASLQKLSAEFEMYLGIDSNADDLTSRSRAVQDLLAEIVANAREIHELKALGQSVWGMSPSEREDLKSEWQTEIGSQLLVDKLVEVHRRHQVARRERTSLNQEMDARCLEQRRTLSVVSFESHWLIFPRASNRSNNHILRNLLAAATKSRA
ncbi:MAG: hypothetical protein M1827_005752 [Pycnora praestabilis]|nr:MAG: hypothetical protein M1827_005752 [Pycnora praestabilis]